MRAKDFTADQTYPEQDRFDKAKTIRKTYRSSKYRYIVNKSKRSNSDAPVELKLRFNR